MNQRTLAITLLIGAGLTLLWTCISPRYMLSGQSTSIAEPPADAANGSYHDERFWHADPAKFMGGLVFIWTGLFGVVLLYPWLDERLIHPPTEAVPTDSP